MALRHFTFLLLLLLLSASKWMTLGNSIQYTSCHSGLLAVRIEFKGAWPLDYLHTEWCSMYIMQVLFNKLNNCQTLMSFQAVVPVEKVLLANVISFFTPILGLHQQRPQSSLSRSQMWYHPLSWQRRCTQDNLVTLIYTLRLLEVTNVAFPAMVGSITTCQ